MENHVPSCFWTTVCTLAPRVTTFGPNCLSRFGTNSSMQATRVVANGRPQRAHRRNLRAEMNRQYHKWYSKHLNRDMELLVFGHRGDRVIVFPTRQGRFFDYENWGLVDEIGRAS